jgi:glycosyltransferase involved in cell wall biosynthesis
MSQRELRAESHQAAGVRVSDAVQPFVSVVIAAHNAERVIGGCLDALLRQPQPAQGTGALECIVVDSSSDRTPAIVAERFPSVRLVHLSRPANLAAMRGRGIALARGEIIAVIDPFSLVDESWLAELVAVHARCPNWIVGGVVDLARAERQSLANWAIYINEYGMFMPPVPGGPAAILPGSNISYKRAALFDGDRPRFDEFWKTFVNWEVEQGHSQMWLAPSICVRLDKSLPFGDFLRTRFDHGRCFAAMRTAGGGRGQRAARAVSAPLLPFLLLWRWGRSYWAKRRRRRQFLLTLPLQLLLFGNWALGEFVGYVWGAGQSCDRLYY